MSDVPEPVAEPVLDPVVPAASLPLLVLLLVVPSLFALAVIGPAWGLLVAIITLGGVAVAAGRRRRDDPIEVAEANVERERFLLVLLGSIPEEELEGWVERVQGRRREEGLDAPAEALVVAPALGSRWRRWLSIEDPSRAAAQARLDDSVALLRSRGLIARGQIGDPDAMLAIEDALGGFPAHRVVVVGDAEAAPLADELAPRLVAPIDVLAGARAA